MIAESSCIILSLIRVRICVWFIMYIILCVLLVTLCKQHTRTPKQPKCAQCVIYGPVMITRARKSAESIYTYYVHIYVCVHVCMFVCVCMYYYIMYILLLHWWRVVYIIWINHGGDRETAVAVRVCWEVKSGFGESV